MPVQNIIKLLKKKYWRDGVQGVTVTRVHPLRMYRVRNSTENCEHENSVQKIAAKTFCSFADQRRGKACLTGKTVGIHNKYFLNLSIEMYRYIEP